MNAQTKIEAPAQTGLALLRAPFPAHLISKLPKPTKAQSEAVKADYKVGIRCELCGGWHHPKVEHLDYVGHAALTDRLLDADPEYLCEPMAFGPDGLPCLDANGGLWVRLTVCGVTRMGYGSAERKLLDKTGGDRIKELIGDAMRNAAMRFGAALDLWHKGDLRLDDDQDGQQAGSGMPDAEWARLVQLIKATGSDRQKLLKHYRVTDLRKLSMAQYEDALKLLSDKLEKAAKASTDKQAETLAEALDDAIDF